MSYSAILPTLPSSLSSRPTKSAHSAHSVSSPHPAQLLDWLRLAARQVFGTELAARIEPYRACSRCVSRVRWCGCGDRDRNRNGDDGGGGVPDRFHRPDLRQLGITPLTPSVILGAQADPYPLAEAVRQRTRCLLEHLLRGSQPRAAAADRPAKAWAKGRAKTWDIAEPLELPETIGLEISILTRSLLVLRDLDLLADLDQRHAVTVAVLIPAADPKLTRRLERLPGTGSPADAPASPDERFELVRTLAAHGIAVEVLCTPIRAGENNNTAVLRELFDRAYQAGAFDVRPAPSHPSLHPTAAESQQLLALFHRLRLERGFPRVLPGRG